MRQVRPDAQVLDELERMWLSLHPQAKHMSDRDGFRASRIGLISAEPSEWEVECDGCYRRSTHGIAYVTLAVDLHLCAECLVRVRAVVDESLQAVA